MRLVVTSIADLEWLINGFRTADVLPVPIADLMNKQVLALRLSSPLQVINGIYWASILKWVFSMMFGYRFLSKVTLWMMNDNGWFLSAFRLQFNVKVTTPLISAILYNLVVLLLFYSWIRWQIKHISLLKWNFTLPMLWCRSNFIILRFIVYSISALKVVKAAGRSSDFNRLAMLVFNW